MNAKLIATVVALARLSSVNGFSEQSCSRSSVYATPGGTSSKPSAVAANPRQGCSSVYVGDVATPTAKPIVADTEVLKRGRG